MSEFALLFEGKAYPVQRNSVSELLQHQQATPDATTYAVRSSVPVSVFESFAASLNTDATLSVTKETAVPLSLLAREFFLRDLQSRCGSFSVSVDDFSSLCERVSELEHRSSSSALSQAIESQEEGLENIRLAVERLKRLIEAPAISAADGARQPRSTREQSVTKVEIPMKEAKSLEGILLYLTAKHGGHVHEKGIVRITSKSVWADHPRYLAKNAADFTYA
jgi:hypothetical protein